MSAVATTQNQSVSLKGLLNNDEIKKKFKEMLGERAQGFFVSVSNCVSNNDLLKKAEPNSVLMAAGVAASLDLPIDANLGFAYIVPYNISTKDEKGNWVKRTVAQFQMGVKGYKQLALRSGQFTKINATDVREGEIKKHDRLTGEIEFEWIEDESIREKRAIVGYVSYFQLINGYSHTLYMTHSKLLEHGKKYSQTFKTGKGLWNDNEESMMLKTVTKLNLSKNAPLSIQMQKANMADQSVIKGFDNETVDVDYVDNTPDSINIDNVDTEKQQSRIVDHINNSKTVAELEEVFDVVGNDLLDLYTSKLDELKAGK